MTRLPELERALRHAAERQQRLTPDRSRRRSRRSSRTLLAALAALTTTGVAVAAGTGLLREGDPVPATREPLTAQPAPGQRLKLAGVRAADPSGGPAWAIGTYRANSVVPITCIVVGRTQAGRLGVLGRDGVFANDGRFHELLPDAGQGKVCGGQGGARGVVSYSKQPPVPASGYTGAVGTQIGGCRERVDLNGPTVSPQTRRRLRNVPECSKSSLRQLVAGFAGRTAAEATLVTRRRTLRLPLRARDDGAFLFVLRPAEATGAKLAIRQRNGTTCFPDRLFTPPNGTPEALQRGRAAEAACFPRQRGR